MGLINLNNEQKLIQNQVRKFAIAELEPISSEIEKKRAIPAEIIKKLSALGLLSPIIPTEDGGAGLDTTSLCLILEEISKFCGSLALILSVNNCLVAYPIIKYGERLQKELYLNRFNGGSIGGYTVNLDIDRPPEEIVKTSGGYLVSAKKDFVLNGEIADFFLVTASSPDSKMLFLLSRNNGKFKIIKKDMLGMKAAGIVGFEFNSLELKEDAELVSGQLVDKVLSEIQSYFNIGLSAISLGIAEASLEASIRYSKERKQFGSAICEFPMVQEMLAEMKIRIEASRNLVYDAANKFDTQEDYVLSSKIAQVYSAESAVFAGIKAVQIYGGYGYIKDYAVERYLRDAKTVQLLGGTSVTLKEKIAGLLIE